MQDRKTGKRIKPDL